MSNPIPQVPEKTTVGNLPASYIRTFVPLGVGWLLSWAFRRGGFILDENSTQLASQALTVVLTAIYYFLVRLAEKAVPQLGWFLGLATQPKYAPTAAPPETPAAP